MPPGTCGSIASRTRSLDPSGSTSFGAASGRSTRAQARSRLVRHAAERSSYAILPTRRRAAAACQDRVLKNRRPQRPQIRRHFSQVCAKPLAPAVPLGNRGYVFQLQQPGDPFARVARKTMDEPGQVAHRHQKPGLYATTRLSNQAGIPFPHSSGTIACSTCDRGSHYRRRWWCWRWSCARLGKPHAIRTLTLPKPASACAR